MQKTTTAIPPPVAPPPEEYVQSVKEAISNMKMIEEDVKQHSTFFWVLSGFLFTAAMIMPSKLGEVRDKTELALGSLNAAKEKQAENRNLLDLVKSNINELEEDVKMILSSLASPPTPANPGAPISPPSKKGCSLAEDEE